MTITDKVISYSKWVFIIVLTGCGSNAYNIANKSVRELEVASDSDLCLAAKSQWQTPQLLDEIKYRNLNCAVANVKSLVSSNTSKTRDKVSDNITNIENKKSIRAIDFANYTYDLRGTNCYEVMETPNLTVRNGEFGDPTEINFGVLSNNIIYGDITGDSEEEAVVTIFCGGMHQPMQPIVFTVLDNKEQLLFAFESGDRAFGGIPDKGIQIKNGLLTIERYEGKAACCPEFIDNKTYRWNGSSFVQVGKTKRRKFE